jgi:MYXO-CTERM domain-containing protein
MDVATTDVAVGDGATSDDASSDVAAVSDGGMDAADGGDPGLVVDPGNTGCGCEVPGTRERTPRGLTWAALVALAAVRIRRSRRS